MQSSINNIYRLDGTVPIAKAIPFGLQHILAMFVSNLTPITLIAASAQPALTQAQIAILLQNAMFVAGIATLIQLYPLWKIGSRLPVVMGVSFTFVTVLSTVAANYGYPAVIGAVMIGGIMEGTLGLLAKYWRKIITPVVAASVVTSIGFSLFTVGARSFGGGYNEDFGSARNLLLGTITLAVCLLWNVLSKGYLKQLSVLAGLVVGYIIAIFMGKVDLGSILSGGLISLPHLLPVKPEFHAGAIVSTCIIFLVWLCLHNLFSVRMSSGNILLTECRTDCHDKGCKPFYHYDRSCMYDPGRTAAAYRKLFRLTSGFCCRRMYHYDVWFYPDIRCTDDRFLRFFTEKYHYCFSFSCCRNRIHHSKRERDLEYFPVDHTVRFCAKCSCCCIYHLHCFKLYPA